MQIIYFSSDKLNELHVQFAMKVQFNLKVQFIS